MKFTIERAGLLKNRFRARVFGANGELVWLTQTYADKRDAMAAIDFLVNIVQYELIAVQDLT